MTMAAKKRIEVPSTIFGEGEEETKERPRLIESSPLEKFLGRERDPETGKLVPKEKPKRPKSVAASTFARTIRETEEMMSSRVWDDCTARHLVALYDLMHRKTYGIEPAMTGSDRYRATLMAGSFVKRAFGGEIGKALEYLRWIWTREIEREKWRRENAREGGRISIGLLFSNRMLDDYRVAMARKRPS